MLAILEFSPMSIQFFSKPKKKNNLVSILLVQAIFINIQRIKNFNTEFYSDSTVTNKISKSKYEHSVFRYQ